MGIADSHEIIRQRIVAALERGTVPWRKPWNANGIGGLPMNFATKKAYRGVNILLLLAEGYASDAWLTYKQAQSIGAQVRKGEKSTPIFFWSIVDEKKSKDGKKHFFLKQHAVFNIAQCDGIEIPAAKPVPEFSAIESCEHIVAGYDGPPIVHGGNRAAYSPTLDRIMMPEKASFHSTAEYYSTLFHELAHSTGHSSRLNRKGIVDAISFGSHNYSEEELVAEFACAFLCGQAGIEDKTIDNSASYIKSWVKKFNDDPQVLMRAASAASKAADRILGVKRNDEGE